MRIAAVLCGAFSLAALVVALAQNYPSGPMRIIVPGAPGGSAGHPGPHVGWQAAGAAGTAGGGG